MSKIFDPDKIYYVSSPDDGTVLIAMNIEAGEREIRWFDTVKERIMEVDSILDKDSEHFVFKRQELGGVYTFVPMSLEVFREKVKNKILIPRDFDTEEEMVAAFKETIKNDW